ncbi:MAG TPA: hypothetical protein VF898_00905 [Chloroflexota bacterium]
MNTYLLETAALAAAAIWLVLLVVTSFNGIAVGAGLLGVLCLTGRSGTGASHKPH